MRQRCIRCGQEKDFTELDDPPFQRTGRGPYTIGPLCLDKKSCNAALAQKAWVSVDDLLPVEGSVVLCYDAETEWIHQVTYRLEGPDRAHFWRNDEGRLIWDVTHWQPAPEKPKEEA